MMVEAIGSAGRGDGGMHDEALQLLTSKIAAVAVAVAGLLAQSALPLQNEYTELGIVGAILAFFAWREVQRDKHARKQQLTQEQAHLEREARLSRSIRHLENQLLRRQGLEEHRGDED